MLKIAFCFSDSRPYNGLINAVSNYATVAIWIPKEKSIYDMMDEFKPDVVVFRKEDRPSNLDALKKEFKQTTFEVLPAEPPTAATIFNSQVVYDADYYSDLLVIGDKPDDLRWFNQFLDTPLRVRIVGPFPYPVAEYVGNVDNKSGLMLIDNARAVMAFNTQTILNVAARGKIVLSPLETEFNIKLSNIRGEYGRWLAIKGRLHDFGEKSRQKILESETYLHRAIDFFKIIGQDSERIIGNIENDCKENRNSSIFARQPSTIERPN